MESSQAESRPSVTLGVALILVAAFFIVFAKDIPRVGLAGDADPGPRAFPLAMAIVVAAGGLIELIRAAMSLRQTRGTRSHVSESTGAKNIASARTSYKNFALLTGATFVYLVALSWLGFQISTLLFSSAVLSWLGARWWSALLAGLMIVIVVRVLFVGLFHVQLPVGVFNLTF